MWGAVDTAPAKTRTAGLKECSCQDCRALLNFLSMLELVHISYSGPTAGTAAQNGLESITCLCPDQQVTAVVGASGGGKSLLIQILSGELRADHGVVLLNGKDWSKHPPQANEIGLVSTDDDSLHGLLSVLETITSALLLRVAGLSHDAMVTQAAHLIALTGLETVASVHVEKLSRVQRRRLQLAVALVSNPILVLCDDFTAELDAKAEREMVALLKVVAVERPGRIVLNASRSLAHLPAYDSAIVLHEGQVCFHGPARAIAHYFTIKNLEDLYPRLVMRPAKRWGESWARHRDSYYDAFKIGVEGPRHGVADDGKEHSEVTDPERIRLPVGGDEIGEDVEVNEAMEAVTNSSIDDEPAEEMAPRSVAGRPSLISQTAHLTSRRWTLLKRNRSEWIKHLALLVGLPVVAVLLIWPNRSGLSEVMASSARTADNEILWPAAFTCLMAPFLMTLMVGLMAVRNGSREVTRHRNILSREQIAGLRPLAWLVATWLFLAPLAIAQGAWMGLFVEMVIGGFPGPAWVRLALLPLTGLAFTSVCLAISANSRSSDRAYSLALLLLISQAILAGAMLGLPRVLGGVLQPFVTIYYGWSGIVDAMSGSRLFELMTQLVRTWFAHPMLAIGALAGHFVIGVILTYWGLKRKRRSV